MKSRPELNALILGVGALAVVGAGYWFFAGAPLLVDEKTHYPQIIEFSQGRLAPSPYLAMLPGFHWLMALFVFVTGADSVAVVRLVNSLFGMLSVVVFVLAERTVRGRASPVGLAQYVFFPLLYPFFFLIYTDVLSLLLVLTAFLFHEKKRALAAACFGIASMIVRQNNIVWFAFLFLLTLHGRCGFRIRSADWKLLLKDSAGFMAGIAAFAVFSMLNRGFALADRLHSPSFSFHVENVVVLLFIFFFLFLPQNIAASRKIARMAARRPELVLLASASALAVYGLFFRVDHPYNIVDPANFQYFLSNRLLAFFMSSPWRKALFTIPALYSLLALAVTDFEKSEYRLLIPFTLLFLVPSWLIEPRYYIIPIVFYQLMRKQGPLSCEIAQAVLFAAASAWCAYGMRHEMFFP